MSMDIKKQVQTVLDRIQWSGDFCGGGKLDIALPTVVINGAEPLVFPLDEAQARKIINQCQLAPFGFRDQTLYNLTVRHTWQLEPKALQLQDSLWSFETMVVLKEIIINDLGLQRTSDEIEIELYKVLLYETGSFFKTHRDTEKKDGMFATLLVVLPSSYNGGELVVRHQQREKVFDFSKDTKNIHYVVLYADCEHELLPVTKGYRLVLAYNVGVLPRPDNQQLVVTKHDTILINQLHDTLASWLAMLHNDKCNNTILRKLVIPLDHEYTQASMKNGPLLKGKDVITGEIVRYACQNHQNRLILYCVMLEQSDNTIKIQYYEPFGESCEPFRTYCSTLDYKHQEKVSISSTDLLNENIWNKLKLKIIEGPWTGNEAEYSHYWYNLSGLLLLPEKYRYDLIVYPSKENGKLIYSVNYELWHVLHLLKDCTPSEDNSMMTSATLDLINEGILKSGFELTDRFRIPLIQCLIALAVLNKTNQEVTVIVKNLIAQTLLIKPFFLAFSNSQCGMYDRMADVLFGAGNLLGWNVIADQILSLFHEELQSASYLLENELEGRIQCITTFLSKFISLITTERNDKENQLNEEETIALQCILTQMIEMFSAVVIKVLQQIISKQQQTKNQHELKPNRGFHFYRNSTFSIKSLCSFLKITSMVNSNPKINQNLDYIIQHIQTLIDHDSANGYPSVDSDYETNVDSMIKYIIKSVIFPFLKEAYPCHTSWYIALIHFCKTVVQSKLETLQIQINKVHDVFQNTRLPCSCTDCYRISDFLKDVTRYEYEYDCRQYRKLSHVRSSTTESNLLIRWDGNKLIKNIKLYENQKIYIELMKNMNDLHY